MYALFVFRHTPYRSLPHATVIFPTTVPWTHLSEKTWPCAHIRVILTKPAPAPQVKCHSTSWFPHKPLESFFYFLASILFLEPKSCSTHLLYYCPILASDIYVVVLNEYVVLGDLQIVLGLVTIVNDVCVCVRAQSNIKFLKNELAFNFHLDLPHEAPVMATQPGVELNTLISRDYRYLTKFFAKALLEGR